ncbi:MAG TPA: PAS domain S-box protein [Verrucomicrobiota bacterium]|nr:PAS domain S-box protein [Verrucomicrobiota bacterium]
MTTGNRRLRVLLVEDSENDAALLQIALERAGFALECERVDTAQALEAALDRQEWDVVIADYVMPGFDGLSALALVKQRGLDIPFIIVSGHITDDTAVAAMKAGAHDYVMKDNLARLGPAVERELREIEVRNARRQAEKKLWEEHSFRQAIEHSVPSGITVVNPEGRQSYVNPAFCEMVGWSEEDLIGARPPFVYWPPEEVEVIAAAMAEAVKSSSPGEGFELRFCKRTGERFDVLVQVTPLRDTFQNISGWLSSITDITRRKQAEAALRRSHEELEARVRERTADLSAANAQLQSAMAERRRLEHELLEITERERRRIGLDLHDDLGQKLSGVALMAKGLYLKLAKRRSPDAKEAAKIHKLIQQAMDHASDVAHDLATLDLRDADLEVALKQLAGHAKKTFGIVCRFQAETAAPRLEPNVVRQLYKITQEALTNAIKHGKTRRVNITLSGTREELVLTVRNSGVPFPSVVSRNAGMGLRIMNYRASLINVSLDIKPGKPDGTVIRCVLPLKSGNDPTPQGGA